MITTKLIFDRKNKARKSGEGVVEIRLTVERKTCYISTGVYLREREWAAGMVVNRPDAQTLNERLAMLFEKANQEVNRCIMSGMEVSAEQIRRNVWKSQESITSGPAFLEWLDKQVAALTLCEGTVKHYRTLLSRLREYDGIRRWEDVTVENIHGFDAWLHKRELGTGTRISDAGVYKYHKCLKAMLNRAHMYGKISENPYDRTKFKRGDKQNVDYLTEDEMKRFEALEVPDGMMAVAKDLFIFQMYTGLSYSDMQAFDIGQYRKEGDAWRHTGERIKTGVAYVSQLLPPAVAVLAKYGMAIPKIDNADYNHQLKALGVMAGIRQPLHSHMARHTFATWMLRNGAKIENVSRMLGHTNIVQTQRYAKVLAQSVHDDFDKVAEKLKK